MTITVEEMRAHYKSFCLSIGITDVEDLNTAIENGEAERIIGECEEWHDDNINFIAGLIKDKVKTRKVITVSGPSSSGKTTFAGKLYKRLAFLGIRTVTISLDDYYKPISEMPIGADGEPDFEDIESIDYKLLNEHLTQLIAGEEIYLPAYSFIEKKRDPFAKKAVLTESDVVVIEGIHGLNPKIASDIDKDEKLKVYCSAISGLREGDDGKRISSETTRMIRRLSRDYYYRDADYKYTLDIWDKVEAGNIKNVFPFTKSADVFFNSALPYEMCIMKKHASKVLNEADRNGEFKEKIGEIDMLLNQFSDLPDMVVPKGSILNEFIKRD